jgi:N-glycosylase/DNA lyase
VRPFAEYDISHSWKSAQPISPVLTPDKIKFVESGKITGLRTEDLDLDATLSSGQVFRWKRDLEGVWRGMVGARRMRLQQSEDGATLYWEADGPDGESAVRSFLRLEDIDLPTMAEGWSRADMHFAEAWAHCPGIRVLRQDPDECFFSFLCASVAPIARISNMLRAVAAEVGTPLDEGKYITFPTAAQLATVSEERLRELGLGFRATRVAAASRRLIELPATHISDLRDASHADARNTLTGFEGVGAKIADCIALFSLDKDGAIPVDTHIWRLACNRYAPELAGRSLTPANYDRVTAAFQDCFGPYAGWAQQILFYRVAVARG